MSALVGLRPTRRVQRLALADRREPGGMLVSELEQRYGELAKRYSIQYDLTSAHTGAFDVADGLDLEIAAE